MTRSQPSTSPRCEKSTSTASTASKEVPEIIPITLTIEPRSQTGSPRSSSFPRARVYGVAQTVTEKIEANYHDDDRDRRKGQRPPGYRYQTAGLADHFPERGGRGRRAEPEKTETCLRDDGPGKGEARLNRHDSSYVREYVPEEKPAPGESEHTAGRHILGLAKRQHRTANNPHEDRDVPDPDCEGAVQPAGAERGD